MSNVFIDNFDSDECEKGGLHQWDKAILSYKTRRGQERFINQEKYLIPGTTIPRREHRRMRIIGGQECCSKCGCPYLVAHNPFLMP